MKKVIVTNKNIGETPLECLERVRKDKKMGPEVPMTYAGRLDPMAEGVLVLLVGEECKNKEKYLKLDKIYEVDVLFGLETDTQDVLGLIKKINIEKGEEIDLEKYVGKFTQEYPVYSSKMLALKETPEEMPTKEVEVYSIEKMEEKVIKGIDIAKNILEKISLVNGDFRQGEIGEEWAAFGEEFGNFPFKITTLRVECSSGTYMRSLAERIGKDAGVGAIAYTIRRVKAGEYGGKFAGE